jgi:glycosyltransferase involved in cell wall biosynthesis
VPPSVKTKTRLRSLYVSYLGLSDPLVETQVVAYLRGLAAGGHDIHLLTYEAAPPDDRTLAEHRSRLARDGITWHWLRYHKKPSFPATLYDIARGVMKTILLTRRYGLDVVHARVHVPAAIGLIATRVTGASLIFDIRGLMAEEYVDAGRWKRRSVRVVLTKLVERAAIRRAAAAVVLTPEAKDLLFHDGNDPRVQVIPCCVDLNRIDGTPAHRARLRSVYGLNGTITMVYVGKLGKPYMQREMARFFCVAASLGEPLHFLIISQSAGRLLMEELDALDVPARSYTVTDVAPKELGPLLAAADCGVAFRLAAPSAVAASPTKIGEYLAAGLPVAASRGIPSVERLLRAGIGVLVGEHSDSAYAAAAAELIRLAQDPSTRQRCRAVAEKHLSLTEVGIPHYQALYARVAGASVIDEQLAQCQPDDRRSQSGGD